VQEKRRPLNKRIEVSFRAKMALMAGAVTGVIVLVACYSLWGLTYRFNLDGLDRYTLDLAQANLQRVQGRSHWQRLDESLSFVSGDDSESPSYRIWMEQRGRVDYISEQWPSEIDPRQWFVNWKDRGRMADAPRIPDRGTRISEANPALPLVGASFYDAYSDGVKWRVGVFDNFYGNLAIAVDVASFDARLDRLRRSFYLVVPIALVVAFISAWLVATRSLRPVERLTKAVEGLSPEGLGRRIERVGHEKEFRRLVEMFNEMMGRLEKSFDLARRFSADASHELKTPLARLQLELESALKASEPESQAQITYSNLLDEMGRLRGIVEKLTLLSSSDAGKLELSLDDVNLSEALESVIEDCEAMEASQRFELSIAPQIYVRADAVLLEQALQNVCGNALKYGKRGGIVRITLRKIEGRVVVEVGNEGNAIPHEKWERLFERFYRRDLSRSERVGGVGLGLSLSREIVRAHGGDLKLVRSDGVWTVFELSL